MEALSGPLRRSCGALTASGTVLRAAGGVWEPPRGPESAHGAGDTLGTLSGDLGASGTVLQGNARPADRPTAGSPAPENPSLIFFTSLESAAGTYTNSALARRMFSCPLTAKAFFSWLCGVSHVALAGDCPGKRPSARRERPFRGPIRRRSGRFRGSERRIRNSELDARPADPRPAGPRTGRPVARSGPGPAPPAPGSSGNLQPLIAANRGRHDYPKTAGACFWPPVR